MMETPHETNRKILQNENTGKSKKAHSPDDTLDELTMRTMNTTPYSVFVRSSPVYATSLFPHRRKNIGASIRSRYRKQLPYRPDPYPYANARWSRLLSSKNDDSEVISLPRSSQSTNHQMNGDNDETDAD